MSGAGWTVPGEDPVDPTAPPSWPPPPGPPSSPESDAATSGRAGWTGWGDPYGSAKPGVIPLRPLGVGEILDGAITTIRRYPRATLGMAAAVVTISQVIQFALVRYLSDPVGSVSDTGGDSIGAAGAAAIVLALMIGFLANVVLTGALTVVIGQAVLGRPIDLSAAWKGVRERFWPLIATALLVLLLNAISLLLVVIPFFFVWPALSLATPALMLERQRVRRALSRSVALVRGQFWRCLGVVLLAWVIKSFVGSALSIPFALLGGGVDLFDPTPSETADLGTSYLLLSTVGSIVAGTVVAPFSAGVSALLYVDRRMRAEGLDVTLAATAAAPAPTPTTG